MIQRLDPEQLTVEQWLADINEPPAHIVVDIEDKVAEDEMRMFNAAKRVLS